VIAAGEAAQRFDRQVAMASSPTARAELMNVGGSVHAAAEACWAVALRGQATERTIAELNLGSVRDRLSRVASDSDDPNVAAARHSLEDQLAVGERLTANVAKVQALLNRQVADLEAAVSHAAELVLTPHVAQQREPELSAVSDRLRAVCVAIDEVNAIEAR
jgi:molybdopterin converting factor small subunit